MNQATKRKTECQTVRPPRLPRAFACAALLISSLALNACLEPGQGTFSSTNALTSTSATSGAKAVQIAFSDNTTSPITSSTSGTVAASFAPPATTGTAPSAGQKAIRLYNADGSFLSGYVNGSPDSNWPSWISSVEVGITGSMSTYTPPGSSSVYASNYNCARFADTGGDKNGNCTINGVTSATCGAPANVYRVSEADCNANTGLGDPDGKSVGVGNGTTADNVYVRVNLNRSGLASTENLMMVVNYAASSYYPADTAPSDCMTTYNPITGTGFNYAVTSGWFTTGGSNLTAENCSDFVWKTYMRHSKTESAVVPFTTFIPPTYSSISGNSANKSGTTVSTRQFIFPIAGDQGIQVLQLSRTFSKLLGTDTNFTAGGACDPGSAATGANGANTPNCAGLVLYSITLFRI
jgi:hypothetical protein